MNNILATFRAKSLVALQAPLEAGEFREVLHAT